MWEILTPVKRINVEGLTLLSQHRGKAGEGLTMTHNAGDICLLHELSLM